MIQKEGADLKKRQQMARILAQGGMDDVHVISRETAGEVLTPKRVELLEALRDDDGHSVRALARRTARDKGAVSRDLQLLAEHDLVTLEVEGNRKIPRLAHSTIVVEPVI